MSSLVGVVLAAGTGTRLLPLTDHRPKALCPVNNVPLVDIALHRVEPVTTEVAVNVSYAADQMLGHLDGRVKLSHESPQALGTAGGLGLLKPWIDGRAVLVHNVDSWHRMPMERFIDGWDGQRVRLLVTESHVAPDFGRWQFCGVSLLPWAHIKNLAAEPSGLWEKSWCRLWEAQQLDLFIYDDLFFDCGTPTTYLAANLAANGGESVIGEGAVVEGKVERSVVWPLGIVREDEYLVDAIRIRDDITVDGTWR